MNYFNYATGLTMTNTKFSKLFGNPVRNPKKDKLTQFHMDVASSIQAVTEEIVLRISRNLASKYNIKNLCLAGGVAVNCVANGKIKREKILRISGYSQLPEMQGDLLVQHQRTGFMNLKTQIGIHRSNERFLSWT